MTMERRRQALGRGLGALIPGGEETVRQGELIMAPIEEVFPNSEQPRRHFEQEALDELTASIREQGILQPLLARKVAGGYELVAGERRLRAARQAGLDRVPLLVRKVQDEARLELALVENIQRENLNPIEEAMAYRELQSVAGGTQEEIARKVGKDRVTVANAIRLLKLPDFVRKELADGTLSAGHGRALLPIKDERVMRDIVSRVVNTGMSVREVERFVSRLAAREEKGPGVSEKPKTAETRDLENRLTRKLESRVLIREGRKGGRIEIRYGSLEELNNIVDRILKR
jgi:ParB family chromosome partitioning protein